MKIYHGNCTKKFAINKHQNSRYGIKAIFGTPHIALARLYAAYRYYQSLENNGGIIYSLDISGTFDTIDYEGKLSYSSAFVSMIYEQSKKSSILLIKNVVDYPDKSMAHPYKYDILAIFNLDAISNIKVVDYNITTIE